MSEAVQQIPTHLASVTHDATLAPFLKPGMSVIIWTQDGSSVLWASDSAWPLVDDIAPDGAVPDGNPLRDRLAVLAAGVAPRKGARLERLRFHSHPGAEIFTCACHALELPSGGVALLTAIVGKIAPAAPPSAPPVPNQAQPSAGEPAAGQALPGQEAPAQAQAAPPPAEAAPPVMAGVPQAGDGHESPAASPHAPEMTASKPATEAPARGAAMLNARLQEPGIKVQAQPKKSSRKDGSSPASPFGSFVPIISRPAPPPPPAQPAQELEPKPKPEPQADNTSPPQAGPAPAIPEPAPVSPAATAPSAPAAEPIAQPPQPAPAPMPAAAPSFAPPPAMKVDALSALRTLAERRPRWRFVWETDAEGRFTRISDELGQAIGASAADILGTTWFDLIGSRVRDEFGEASNGFVGDITWTAKDVMWRVSDSDLMVPVSLSAVPIHDGDRVFQGYRGFGVVDLEHPQPWGGRAARPAGQMRPQPAPAMPPPEPDVPAAPKVAENLTEPQVASAPAAPPAPAERAAPSKTPLIMGGMGGPVQARVGERPASPLMPMPAASAKPAEPPAANPEPDNAAPQPEHPKDDKATAAEQKPGPADAEAASASGIRDWAAASSARLGTNLAATATFKSALSSTPAFAQAQPAPAAQAQTPNSQTPIGQAPPEPAQPDAPVQADAPGQADMPLPATPQAQAEAPMPEAPIVTEAAEPAPDHQQHDEQDTAADDRPGDTPGEPGPAHEPDAAALTEPAQAEPAQIEPAPLEPANMAAAGTPQEPPAALQQAEPASAAATVTSDVSSGDKPKLTEADRQALRDIARALGDKISKSGLTPLPRATDAPIAGAPEPAAPADQQSADPTAADIQPADSAPASDDALGSDRPTSQQTQAASERMLQDLDDAVQSGTADSPVEPAPQQAEVSEPAETEQVPVAASDEPEAIPAPEAPSDNASVRSALDRVPVPIIIGSGNSTLYANRAFFELSGFADVGGFDEKGGLGERLLGMPGNRGPARMIFRTRTNIEVPVATSAAPIDWQGEPATMVTLRPDPAREQSDKRRAAELDLRAQEARARELASMLDTATDGVVVIDDKGLVLSLNKSAEALFGYDQANVAGEPFTVLLATESHPLALDYLEGLKANGVASILNDGRDVIGRVRQGGRIPLFMTMGRISDAPNHKFCAVLRDMSAWKKAEGELVEARRAAEKSNAQKSDFLAKISHEIRTPMNAIIGFAEVMLEERFGPVGNERYKEYLRDMHASGGLVISLVNDLLDLAKIEAGRMEMDFASVDLNEIMTSCVSLLQPQAGQSRVVLRTSLAPNLPPVVADERSLRQIALNLLSNAVKFTDSGGQVIVSTALTDRGEVAMRVRDTGIGMTDKEVKSALEPFRQITTTRRSGGTGLGLPLTKALVEANRGAFSITSAKGEGTLVEIVFPPTRVLAG